MIILIPLKVQEHKLTHISKAFVVGRTSKLRMKNIKKKKDPADENGLDTNEDYGTFLKIGVWPTYIV